jgi:chromosome segregation ATPase
MANRTASHPRDDAPLTNGHHAHSHHDTRPTPAPPTSASAAAPAPATNKKGKAKKQPDLSETSNLLAARISQLELDAQGAKEQEAEVEREVRKATRELTSTTAKMSDMEKVDFLTKECSRLLAEMKRHERESQKQKKRADQLQKEKDKAVSDHSKTIGIKNKLEGLCRDLQKDSNKLKVVKGLIQKDLQLLTRI